MAKHRVVGVIEMDPLPDGDHDNDAYVGDTLRRLRHFQQSFSPDVAPWEIPASHETDDAVASGVIEADLHQFRADLEREMVLILERLLVTS